MTVQLRRLGRDDKDASLRLSREAFGGGAPPTPPPAPGAPASSEPAQDETWPADGVTSFGALDGGELVAKANGRAYESVFHGRRVATCGVAGVTVAAEYRGSGLLRELLRAVVADGLDRGAVISTLFPTAPGIYRGFGWELVGELTGVAVPTAALAQVRRPAGVRTRRATARDFPAVRDCYARWTSVRNGPLTRDGALFPADADAWLAEFTAVTLAVADRPNGGEEVQGVLAWQRGQGYGPEATITADDLFWTTAAARDALLATLGTFASVTGTTRIETSGTAELDLALPMTATQIVHRAPYMLRVIDVPGALAAVSPAPEITGATTFAVAGDDLAGTDGSYRLDITDSALSCERLEAPTGEAALTFTPRGLALTWAGVLPVQSVVAAGLATARSDGDGARTAYGLWDTLGLSRPVHIRDYF